MKKIIILAIAATSFLLSDVNSAYAQSDQLVNIGLKGGLNYSWLSLKDTKDETGKIGFHAGVVARVNIATHFALQGEALYTTKGSKVEYDNAFFDGKTTLTLNYIDVPVLLVLKLNENINIQVGPYASFILSANAKNDSNVDLFDFEKEVDKDNFKSMDYGLAAGIGVEVQHLMGGVRYTQGLQKIETEKSLNGVNYSFSDAKNSMVQLYIGFLF